MEVLKETLTTLENLVTESLGGATPPGPATEEKFTAVFNGIKESSATSLEVPLFCFIVGLLAYAFPAKLGEFLETLDEKDPLRSKYLERLKADSSAVALECLTEASVVYDSAKGFIDLVNGVLSDSDSE